MSKSLVLSGGGEFEPASNALDRASLALTRISYPTLVIVPAAAAAHAKRTVRAGVRYFNALGAEAAFTMVVDEETAALGDKAVSLENTDVIYLTDGNPLDAVNALKGQPNALRTMLKSWERGAVISACGASAMAFCEHYWDGGTWEKGLGVFKKLAILPHYQVVAGRYTYARLKVGLPDDTQIIGLEDGTGIVVRDLTAKVIGAGAAVVFTPDDELEYLNGETFTLNSPWG